MTTMITNMSGGWLLTGKTTNEQCLFFFLTNEANGDGSLFLRVSGLCMHLGRKRGKGVTM